MQAPRENSPAENSAVVFQKYPNGVEGSELVRAMLARVADYVVVCNEQQRITCVSQSALRLCECSPLTQSFDTMFPLQVAGEGASVPFSLEPIFDGQGLDQIEVKLRRGDDDYLFLLLSALPLWGGGKEVRGCIVTMSDVTRHKRAQEEKNRLLTELAWINSEKESVISLLARELRGPLGPIVNAIEAFELRNDQTECDISFGIIRRQTQRIAQMLNEVEDLYHLGRGKLELRRERVDLAPIIRRAVDDCRAHYQESRRELSVNLPDESLWVQGDPARLEQMVRHLLCNAAQYSQPGGQVRLSAERREDEAVLRVQDNGLGIAREDQDRIFEPFFQAGNTASQSAGGLGIGLSLVRGLASLHGGGVDVYSEGPGQGSEFILRLPLTAGSMLEGGAPVEPIEGDKRPLRILVVEDNRDIATSMAELLEQLGYEARVAYDGLEAVQKAIAFEPEVVLLDIGLPHMDGYHVARLLRQKAELSSALIVAITGYSLPRDIERSYYAGIDLHLTKPVNLNFLKELLAAHSSHSISL